MVRQKRRKSDKTQEEYQEIFEELKDKIEDLEDELTKAKDMDTFESIDVVKINRLVKSVWSLAGIFLSIVIGVSYVYIESKKVLDMIEKHNTQIVEIVKEDKRLLKLIEKQSDINNREIAKIVHSTMDDRLGAIIEILRKASEDAAEAKELVEGAATATMMNLDIMNNYKYLLQHKEEIFRRLDALDKNTRYNVPNSRDD